MAPHCRCALALPLLPALCAAQDSLTIYGRVDLSAAQQVDAPPNKELRNGSASRFGLKGEEDLGDGLCALFQIEHRKHNF